MGAATPDGTARAFSEPFTRIGPRCLKRGNHAEDKAGQHGHGRREGQHAAVEHGLGDRRRSRR